MTCRTRNKGGRGMRLYALRWRRATQSKIMTREGAILSSNTMDTSASKTRPRRKYNSRFLRYKTFKGAAGFGGKRLSLGACTKRCFCTRCKGVHFRFAFVTSSRKVSVNLFSKHIQCHLISKISSWWMSQTSHPCFLSLLFFWVLFLPERQSE